MLDSVLKFLSDNPTYVLGGIIAFVVFAMMQINHRNNLEIEDKRSKNEAVRSESVSKNHSEWQKFIEGINNKTNDSVKQLSNSVYELAKTVSTQSVETSEAVREVQNKIESIHKDLSAHREEFRRLADTIERRGGSRL